MIRVRADMARALKELDGLKDELGETGKAGKKASTEISRTEESIEFLKRAAAAYISLRFAKQVFMQADAMQALSIRVNTATKETGDYERVWGSLLSTAIDTGAEMETMVGLFQNMARSAPELDATTSDVLRLTEAVSQLGIISGTPQANLRAGLTQFSQMLSGQVARAEEFNSLLENVPEIANRIAKGMGMTVGELRAAVLQGNVLSKDVFESLLSQTREINQEFAQVEITAGRAWSAAVTAASAQLKRLDDQLNTTSGWASILQQLAIVMTPDSAETELGKRAGELFREQERLLARLAEFEDVEGPFKEANVKRLQEQLAAVNAELEELRKKSQDMAGTGGLAGGAGDDSGPDPEVVKSVLELTQKFRDQAATLGATNEQAAVYRTTLGDLKGATDDQKKALIEAARALDTKTAAQKAEQDLAKNRAQDQEFIQSIENEIKLVGMNERAQAQFNAVMKLTTAATDEQRTAAAALAGQLYDLEQATPVKQFAALQAQYREITDLLSQDVQRVQAKVEAGLISELAGRQEILSLQETAAQTLQRDVLPGLEALAEKLGPDAEAAVRKVRQSVEELGRASNAALGELRTGFESSFSTFFQDAISNIDSLKSAFESLGDSILATLSRIVSDRIAQYFVDFILRAFAAGGDVNDGASGFSSDGMGPPSSLAGKNHTGGVAGLADASKTVVPTALFRGAPRFHTGGVPGLSSDEVPIIAKRGEGIFTPAQMKAMGPAAASNMEVHIHPPSGYKAREERSTGSNGQQRLDVMFDEMAAGKIRSGGKLDQALQSTYGLTRQGRG